MHAKLSINLFVSDSLFIRNVVILFEPEAESEPTVLATLHRFADLFRLRLCMLSPFAASHNFCCLLITLFHMGCTLRTSLYQKWYLLHECKVTATIKKTKKGFQDLLSLNAGQKYCRMLQREHSAILLTFIKLPVVIKTFVLSILSGCFTQVLLYSLIMYKAI